MFDMNPEDQKKIEQDHRNAKEEAERLAEAYAFVFGSKAGQIVFKDLRERCNADCGCVRNKVNPDPNSVLFESGKQAVFNHIKHFMRHGNERRKRKQ